ncbi:glutamyl-tRNA amidotransferase [Saccharospirillum sp. MSK14-1]|uniref:GatB/YqeY domain-containing protein n=1 Tax=Saccharospirillum sp. MSK14-1 TaxID=1897632 RepID=UPI000D3AF8A6|nr:GatB/YqeY domain-containing protein [Saccharospirillum sp. MSK14-1]PTY38667.1 glutamyl-tRNA amidotransferase [Saccharospirillum sp. MSK14-1]
MSELKQTITEAMKDAMRAKDKARLGTIRLILAELKRIEVDERIELDDARVLAVLDKMNKQRRDSIAQFEAANRDDLAAVEREEMEVIATFLPAALSEDEINALVDQAISQTGASGMQDMGKVMGVLKPQLQGRADMGAVSKTIKARLG